jgi:hypothetical protein
MGTTKFIIYCHIHIESGRRYIGLTKKTMMQRWNQHIYSANSRPEGKRSHFWAAIRKFGPQAFSHEVLEICETLEEANLAEAKWIDHFNSRDPQFGFNLAPGGEHIPHPIRKNPYDDPGFKARAISFLTKINDNLTSIDRSNKAKKLWSDSKYREKVTISNQWAYSDPIIRDKATSAMKESFSRPESKKKRSKSSSLMWRSDEYRDRHAEFWKDPDFRNKCQSGLIHGASLNKEKTHCKNGHEYTEENTYINTRGSRECRTCLREHGRKNMRIARARKRSPSRIETDIVR